MHAEAEATLAALGPYTPEQIESLRQPIVPDHSCSRKPAEMLAQAFVRQTAQDEQAIAPAIAEQASYYTRMRDTAIKSHTYGTKYAGPRPPRPTTVHDQTVDRHVDTRLVSADGLSTAGEKAAKKEQKASDRALRLKHRIALPEKQPL
jgi:hypothetical protein